MGVEPDLHAEHLDVYDTRTGLWNPDHGEVEIPDGWELLPSGDAFLTRRVKASGPYWVAWKPRSRQRRHRRLIGVVAPTESIEAARAAVAETAENRYRSDLQSAIIEFLGFDDPHQALADQIAAEASERAVAVGSGRVGRTKTIDIGRRAELAARAYIRHHLTSYEDDLIEQEVWDDEFLYREVKRSAQKAVDDFLVQHRPPA